MTARFFNTAGPVRCEMHYCLPPLERFNLPEVLTLIDQQLDQLADKLREERVRRVIEPILAGETTPEIIPTDDIDYARDLGLIRIDEGQLAIANPIYQEVIPREITYNTQLTTGT